ncbi:MAG: ABC transporter permease subunit [Chloroflexi bacterium]|nr:ABC transporter permease subunit [Ardenticatenaceae bacterium]MBL1127699.1 ABC transporter permease subunit [Chloroflexota bacterium]NOG33764.1 ABC transporter permease subunit [Chloroflexota bacterium]GIK54348.1 MAG: hypothetical protein BroJett015_00110 [Chloroflexota bacterium]
MNTYQLNNLPVLLNPPDTHADSGAWWENCVIYQIYPRSFQDSDGDGVGDLPGIIDRLDYLKELGVDALWLSPIYPSPMADFGYDVADYCDVDPLFGSLAVFDRLLAEAHGRNLKVILDYVANHTSSEHPWFRESRRNRDNAKRDWYIWRDGRENGEPPNNWVSLFGGSAWTWDSETEQYYLHLFSPQQPDLNWRNPEVAAAMHDVLRFWLDRGVDGFRMDAVTMLIKHAEMPDMPPAEGLLGAELLQKHIYVHNQPEVHDLIRGFRQVLDMLNSRLYLVYFYLGFGVALSTFMYHGFIKSIPMALDESATIEGANKFQIYRHIILPMLKPITATIVILNSLWIWNDFLLSSLALFQKSRTLPLSTFSFFGRFTTDFGLAMAGLVLSMLPIIILYLALQRQIISGISEGAVK